MLGDSLRPSQQSFSYVGTGLPGLNRYQARINVSCSRTQHSDTGEAGTRSPLSFELSTLPLSHCIPFLRIKKNELKLRICGLEHIVILHNVTNGLAENFSLI